MPIILSDQEKNKENKKMKSVPVAAIRDGIIFPYTESVLTFGRPRSLTAVEKAMKESRQLIILMQKDPRINQPSQDQLYHMGTMIKIDRILRSDGDVNA